MDKNELLHWLSKQEAAWAEMCSFFDTSDFEDVTIEEILEYIEDDSTLRRKYVKYFGDDSLIEYD